MMEFDPFTRGIYVLKEDTPCEAIQVCLYHGETFVCYNKSFNALIYFLDI
jgi:hypothetical protein